MWCVVNMVRGEKENRVLWKNWVLCIKLARKTLYRITLTEGIE